MRSGKVSLKNIFWLFLAAAQIVFLCAVSWKAGGATIDNDAGKVFTHMMAIWESGTLAVPDWQYITTMELDCTTILALPFYGLTRNPILAFWCGNVILLAGWAALLYTLVRRMGGSIAKASLTILAVLLPYEFYILGYWNMLFLNASQYAFKVMLPLLLIVLLLAPERPRRRDWALLVLYLAGCWLTALSSGIYVAACGLAPVLCLAIYEWLQSRLRATPYRLACLFGSAAATLAGLFQQHLLGIASNASSMELNRLDTIRDNAANCLIGFFRLFGAVPNESLPVFSLDGISTLLRMLLAAALLALAVWFSVRALSGSLPAVLHPARYLVAVFWWNLAVLLATNTRYGDKYFEYRYHLIGAVPLIILAFFVIPVLTARPLRLHRAAAGAGTAMAVAFAFLVNWNAVQDIWQPDGTFGINGPEREICGIINTMDVEDVIVAAGSGTTEICGALDPSHRYITLLAMEESEPVISTWDGYLADTDGLSYDKPAAVVCTIEAGLASLPDYLANLCVEVGRASGYIVFQTTSAPLVDGVAGLPFGSESIDYPDTTSHSPKVTSWYSYQGEIDAQRRLHTDPAGGEALRSPSIVIHTAAQITLTCESEAAAGAIGKLQLWQGDTLLAESDVPSGNVEVTLQAPACEDCYLLLTFNPGCEAVVGPIYFEALS